MKIRVIWLPTSLEDKTKACIDASPKTQPVVFKLNPFWTWWSDQKFKNCSIKLFQLTILRAGLYVKLRVTHCLILFGGSGHESKRITQSWDIAIPISRGGPIVVGIANIRILWLKMDFGPILRPKIHNIFLWKSMPTHRKKIGHPLPISL